MQYGSSPQNNKLIILILGALSTVSPFAIDMYLAAFPQIANALHTDVAKIALSLSSYFAGLAAGQLFYGPLLDRFGRKRPLYVGLSIFVLASIGCLKSTTVEGLIAFRFLQALGGCSAQVASMAMVRDFFPPKEGAKIFSMLMLILGVSPLLAPTAGSIVATALGWQWVFILLATIVFLILMATAFLLPEGHQPDPEISLRFSPIMKGFADILKTPQFYTYAFAGAFSFAGLFVYVAGSPNIFMTIYGLNAHVYGVIFAFLATGFIGGSQLSLLLARKFSSEQIFKMGMICQSVVGLVFLLVVTFRWAPLPVTIALLFLTLLCAGTTNPNGGALALAPFTKTVGSASALLGFLQIGVASLVSAGVGILGVRGMTPIIALLAVSTWIGLAFLLVGKRKIIPAKPLQQAPIPEQLGV